MEKNIKKSIKELEKLSESEAPKQGYQPRFVKPGEDDILEKFQASKIDTIKNAVEEIEALIVQRQTLTQELFRDIDQVHQMANNEHTHRRSLGSLQSLSLGSTMTPSRSSGSSYDSLHWPRLGLTRTWKR